MTEVHILDRFAPELQEYLLIDEIGSFLIAEGLLSGDDYLVLTTKRTSKKKAVVELIKLIKSKGPDCIQSFLHALQRLCTETSTPHQGHLHLWELFQTNITMTDSLPLKKQKSKSVLSLLGRTKRNKNSRHKEASLSPPTWTMPTPYSTAVSSLKVNPSSTGATAVSMMGSAALSGSSPSDDDNYRHLSPSSSDDSNSEPLSQPPPPAATKPIKTERSLIQELVIENEKLKKDLNKKTKDLDKQREKTKEESQYNEELKAQNEMYENKIKLLENDAALKLKTKNEQITKHTSLIDELKKQVESLQLVIQKVQQEKESLEQTMQGSMIPTRGPISRPKRSHSLSHMHRISESSFAGSSSLTSINEIEEFKYELNRIDAVLHSKLNHLAQVFQEPSKMSRRWRSNIELAQHSHHQESNAHSQT